MIRLSAVLLAGTLLSVSAQASIKCVAIHEWLSAQNRLEHKEIELKRTIDASDMIVLEADLDGHNFSLRGDPRGEEFLAFLTVGPEYSKGIVINANFNGAGQLRISSVDGTVVHKLSCQK